MSNPVGGPTDATPGSGYSTDFTDSLPTEGNQNGRTVVEEKGGNLPSVQNGQKQPSDTKMPGVSIRERAVRIPEHSLKSLPTTAEFKSLDELTTAPVHPGKLETNGRPSGADPVDLLAQQLDDEDGGIVDTTGFDDESSNVDRTETSLRWQEDDEDSGVESEFRGPAVSPKPTIGKQRSSVPQQMPPPPGLKTGSANGPKLTVESLSTHPDIQDIGEQPPLTQKQQTKKKNFMKLFSGLFQLIKQHRNVASMGAGGACTLLGAGLMATPAAPVGAVILALGFTVFMVGFANAMYSAAEAPPGQIPTNPDANKPKNDEKETKGEGKNGEDKKVEESTSEASGGTAPLGGKFVKIEKPEGSETGQLETEIVASGLAQASKQQQVSLDLPRQKAKQALQQYITEASKLTSAGPSAAQVQAEKQLEQAVIEILSDFAARSNLDPGVLDEVGESLEVVSDTLLNTPNLSEEARKEAVTAYFKTIVEKSGAKAELVAQLHRNLAEMTQGLQIPTHAEEAARELIDSVLKMLDAMYQQLPPPPLSAVKPELQEQYRTKEMDLIQARKTNREQLDTLLDSTDVRKIQQTNNMHHFMLFKDAMKVHQGKASAEKVGSSEFRESQKRVFTDAVDVLEGQDASYTGASFRKALLTKVDADSRPYDHTHAQEILGKKHWFDDKT